MIFVGCDDTNDNLVVQRGVAVSPIIESITSSFFELSDLDNAFVEFKVTAEFPAEVAQVLVKVGHKDKTAILPPYSSIPVTITLSVSDIANVLGVNVNDLVLGDVFSFQLIVENMDGITTFSNKILNATVACASSLEGAYTCVANGSSTDPGPSPEENPAVDFTTTITFTATAVNGEYIISDFSGGLDTFWYDIYGLSGEYPGMIKDVCGDLSYINTKGPFGSPISGTGAVDEVTGVITLHGVADSWGDEWDLVLTPQ
ncbi:hypothetical protein L3073_06250 [Ancylomarina sp. DW003]|nr:hypothetical protein [Ancylomarina sp. DW003]MDE5421801.1 hypothetical protein [Ancylomarina sp. DW003]